MFHCSGREAICSPDSSGRTNHPEEMKQSRLGQVFGFILGLVGMSLATLLALYDHETIAGIFGTTTILGLLTVFVLGKKDQQKELATKNKLSVS